MPRGVFIESLGKRVYFPDDWGADKIEEWVRSQDDEAETDLYGAAKHGARTILPKIQRGFSTQAEGVLDLLPLPESWESGTRRTAERHRESADEKLRKLMEEFTPDTLPEKIVSGLAGATGDLVPLVPYMAAAGLAAPASPIIAGAVGLGAHGFIEGMGEEGKIEDALKHGGIGALEGAAFGGVGKIAGAVAPKFRGLTHATGAGAIGGTSSALQGGDAEDTTANAAVMAMLSALTHRGGKKAPKGQEAPPEKGTPGYDEFQRLLQERSIGPEPQTIADRIPGVRDAQKWVNEKWINSGWFYENLAAEGRKRGYDPAQELDPSLTSGPARPSSVATQAKNAQIFGYIDPMRPTKTPIVDPIYLSMREAGMTNEKMKMAGFAYLIAKRDLARTDVDIKHAGSGDPAAAIRGARTKYGDEQLAKFDKFGEEYNKYGNALIDTWRNGGKITDKRAKELKAEDGWISFQREIDTIIPDSPFMKLKGGSGQRIADPIVSLERITEKVFREVNQAEHARALIDMLEQTGNFELHAKKLDPKLDVNGKPIYRPSFSDRERAISFNDYGEQKSYELSRELYDSVKPADRPMMPRALDLILGGPKRMATLGMTGLKIGFQVVTNPIRDLFTSGMQSKDPGPAFGIKHVGRVMESVLGRVLGKEEMAEAFARYKLSGATASGPLEADMRSAKAYSDMITARAGGARAVPAQFVKHPIETMRALFSWSEDVNRFPEWLLMEKKYGKGTAAARLAGGKAAADISLDFMRMGAYTRWANEFIPFFNASIQGLDKFSRTIRERPVAAMAQGTMNITAPMLALWAINKDEEWYQEIPVWEKTIFAHFKMGDEIIRMPLPFEWGILFGSLPVALADSNYQKDPKRLKDGVDQMLKTMMPDLWPQFLKPVAEVAANRDFFRDSNIESRNMQNLLPGERHRESTPALYKGIGGAIDESPAKLQHLAEAYTGGLSKTLTDPIDFLSGHDMSTEKIPLLGRITASQSRQGQSVADFFDGYSKMQQAWRTAKKRHGDGDILAARRILEDNAADLGLNAGQIALMMRQRNWTLPERLKKFNKVADNMSKIRKRKGENKEITALARLALGRN